MTRGLTVLAVVLAAWGGLAGAPPAAAASSNAATQAVAPADFPALVALGLRQSPALRHGLIELDVRRLDEEDGRAGYWPAVYLQAGYLINAPSSSERPYALHLTTGEYNPVGAYFTARARREISRLARIAHLQGMAEGLRQAGELFLSLAALERAGTIQRERIAGARRSVAWCTRRLGGGGTTLELRAAEQELAARRLEAEQLAVRQRQARRRLGALLGLPADAPLPPLRTAGARAQVLGDLALPPDRDRAERLALDLLALEIQIRLQELGVRGAYAEYLPRPSFNLRTTDPLDETQEHGLFFSVSLSMPLWDAGRRRRNVERQKALLAQRGLDRAEGRAAWRRAWEEARDQAVLAAADAALAAGRVRLAELTVERATAAVSAGQETWPALHAARQAAAVARLQALELQLAADRDQLALRHLGRELLDRYVRVADLVEEAAADAPPGGAEK